MPSPTPETRPLLVAWWTWDVPLPVEMARYFLVVAVSRWNSCSYDNDIPRAIYAELGITETPWTEAAPAPEERGT